MRRPSSCPLLTLLLQRSMRAQITIKALWKPNRGCLSLSWLRTGWWERSKPRKMIRSSTRRMILIKHLKTKKRRRLTSCNTFQTLLPSLTSSKHAWMLLHKTPSNCLKLTLRWIVPRCWERTSFLETWRFSTTREGSSRKIRLHHPYLIISQKIPSSMSWRISQLLGPQCQGPPQVTTSWNTGSLQTLTSLLRWTSPKLGSYGARKKRQLKNSRSDRKRSDCNGKESTRGWLISSSSARIRENKQANLHQMVNHMLKKSLKRLRKLTKQLDSNRQRWCQIWSKSLRWVSCHLKMPD